MTHSIFDLTQSDAFWALETLRESMNLYKGENFEFMRFLLDNNYADFDTSEDEIMETMAQQFAEDGNGRFPADYIQNWENSCGQVYDNARTTPEGKAAIAHVKATFAKALERFPAEALED